MRGVNKTLATCGILLVALLSSVHPQAPVKNFRIGTYDNRAIAVAYAASKYNPVAEKMKELEKAKVAGNTDRAKELEAWGEKFQRALHRQGFGRVPVNDILALVREKLPGVANKAGLEAIAMQCDFALPGVETVDVTDELVLMFDPSEKTLATVKELRKNAPIDLDELEGNHEH